MAEAARARGLDPVVRPLPDGGEGTAEALADLWQMPVRAVAIDDPLGRLHTAPLPIGVVDGKRTAVVESAAAIGLPLLSHQERDPWHASSRGVGQLIRGALDAGAARILVALGGTATVDGGAGLLYELGVRFFDPQGLPLSPRPRELLQLDRVDAAGLDPRLTTVEIQGLSDVESPLLGPAGARMYMRQKGVQQSDEAQFEQLLAKLHPAFAHNKAAGAAGGLGAAVLALGGRIVAGAEFVMAAQNLDALVRTADVVVGGEGTLDAQTAQGKSLARLAQACRAAGVPLIALVGGVEASLDGVIAVPIVPGPCTTADALRAAERNVRDAMARVLDLLAVGRALERNRSI